MITAPCKDCKERHYLCHSKCDKYILFKEQKELERTYNNRNNEYFDYKFQKMHEPVKRNTKSILRTHMK